MNPKLLFVIAGFVMLFPVAFTQPTPPKVCNCEDNPAYKDFCSSYQKSDPKCYTDAQKKDALSKIGLQCPKTCDVCCMLPGFSCDNPKEANLNCSLISSEGLCSTSDRELKSLIIHNCPFTCGLCGQECEDQNALICSALASDCSSDQAKKLCPKTCHVCEPFEICIDTNSFCPKLKNKCNDAQLKPIMDMTCNKTCGLCDGGTPSTAIPCNDEPWCSSWVLNGFCTNPFYQSQIHRCARSCGLC